VSSETPDLDGSAVAVFGDRLPIAERFAQLLMTDGVTQGLIGPREGDRLWQRHLVNSALVGELLPIDARVVDVGSGAGLPGLALACCRGDLRVDLLESMQRRVSFLRDCVSVLGFESQVRVTRGRAEATEVVRDLGGSEWVTARAVAPLDVLVAWCLPLLRRGGRLLALKGDRAEAEVREYAAAVRGAGGFVEDVVLCGTELVTQPTRVVVVRKN
jgi:16S rRNA (guanine527-N7)-methyltransferase